MSRSWAGLPTGQESEGSPTKGHKGAGRGAAQGLTGSRRSVRGSDITGLVLENTACVAAKRGKREEGAEEVKAARPGVAAAGAGGWRGLAGHGES